jgi:HAD superfamily hydrolase (TIGR01509 family)
LFLDALATEGLHVFQSSVEFVQQVRAAELATGVVTASRNRAQVLATAGIQALFDVHVDGLDAASLNLPGKPDPATFLEAAHRLDLAPRRAVVVEDALAGVEAGRRGGFGLVVGVDRANLRAALLAAGANLVVSNLSELRVPGRRGRR